jgi:hypothetical protein
VRLIDHLSMLATGTQVQINFPGELPGACGRLVGFYANEPCRAVVLLPSGESLVVMETDISPASE